MMYWDQTVMLGIDIIGVGLLPAMLVALLAGILSFLSPCVLPIVPPYLAYMGGVSLGEFRGNIVNARRQVFLSASFFVLGLSTVFLLLGFAASALGAFFIEYQNSLSKVSGVIIIVFAFHFLRVLRVPFLDQDIRIDAKQNGGSAFGAYLLGLAFAFGWTPCIGPQLGAILSLAAQEASVQRGTFLLAIYALGLGIPFMVAAFFIQRTMGIMRHLKGHMKVIEISMGVLLLIVGLALLAGAFSTFSFWLVEVFDKLNIPLLG